MASNAAVVGHVIASFLNFWFWTDFRDLTPDG